MRCPIMKNIKKYNRYNIPKKNDDFGMKILRLIASFIFSSITLSICLFLGPIGFLIIGIATFMSYHTIFGPYEI